MTPQARVQAAIEILDEVVTAARGNGAAADTIVARYFKTRRYAGSKDRRGVRDLVYRAIRIFGEPPASGRAAMIGLAQADAEILASFGADGHAPPAIGESETATTPAIVPAWLGKRLPKWLNDGELAALLDRAPLDLRVNRLKSDVATVCEAFPEAEPIAGLADGLRLPHGTRVDDRAAYQAGLVEIQDAGSQLIVEACAAKPGEVVVDLCAGAGGKTLALAAAMNDEGRLIACDAIRSRFAPLPDRAARAGATVETRLLDMNREHEALDDLLGTTDLVLVDAPCSGTGTWRRNPESRWRITPAMIRTLASEQARLLDIAASLVAPGGRIVYAVCSLVEEEGPRQVEAFLSRHSGWSPHDAGPAGRSAGQGRVLSPAHDGCDGFFFAALMRDDPSA